jgi:hypothetical protein
VQEKDLISKKFKKMKSRCLISAGISNNKGIKVDSGAVGNGYTEATLAVEFRNSSNSTEK